ncbi:MAG TPA: murein transglycosylase A [Geminicoccus sp.]|uniref:murein transglycosylase A n=1 Tax=Geminicoccus sp. TaxID=2024832 RepID=UPI002BDDA6A2|nr:murein transglycosylase A [Geminicoccus sp.]HWL69022.1 murein transglycosylase A [Geminicoccus sp.]
MTVPSRLHAPARRLLAGAVLLLGACAAEPPKPEPGMALKPAAFTELAGWPGTSPSAALRAFVAGCGRIEQADPDARFGGKDFAGKLSAWQDACRQARITPTGDASAQTFFEAWFQPFAITDGGKPEGLITGYYEPVLEGSREPSERFRIPLHARPADLVTVDLGQFAEDLQGRRVAGRVENGRLVLYPDRAAIDQGALSDQQLELLWVDDPIGKFFLQIQGSGRVRLPDGTVQRIGYADQNGRLYHAIGRELVASGELSKDEVSLQTIRAWLEAHPDQAEALMWRNPSYVFFQPLPDLPDDQGAPGALGIPLTAGHSLAVDRSIWPLGAPMWLDTHLPPEVGGAPLRTLAVAQDTGGAIKGAVRADLFLGVGPTAERIAGPMKSQGRMWILLPKAAAPTS